MNERLAARLAILGAALLFSTGGAAIKATVLTSFQVASFRSGIAAVALLLLVPAARRAVRPSTFLVAVAYAATVVLFVLANKLTTAANTIFLQATAPLFILLLGPLALRERVRGRDVALMAAMAAGFALFFVGRGPSFATAPDPFRGNVLAAASGLTWALTILGLRWKGRDDPWAAPAAVIVGNLLAFLAPLPWALPVAATRAADWLIVAFLGVVQIGVAYRLLTFGLRRVEAFEASLLLLLEPALSPLWAWLAHGENPGPWANAGGLLILSATVVKAAWDARAPARA